MAKKLIKGLTVELGGDSTELIKAMDAADSKAGELTKELNNVNRLLKFDPKNTELLAQKQKVLAEVIGATENKLKSLQEAEKVLAAQLGDNKDSSAQYRELQREIIVTQSKLDKYKDSAKEAAKAVEELGDSTDDAADGLKEEEKAAEEAEEATDDLNDTLLSAAKGGFAALAAAAIGAVTAIVGTAEASREYRNEMAKLDTAFENSNHTAEAAKETYGELQGVLGETDQAVEAANHLAQLCDTEEELAAMTEAAIGVYAVFGASLPIESLTEAANESAKTGQVTGALADAINWAAEEGETYGVVMKEATEENEEWNKAVEAATTAEDYFNLALQECNSEQERQNLITKTLTKSYKKAAVQYKNTNKEVIRANKANEKWNETLAKMGKHVEPVLTDFKELGISLLENAEEPLKEVTKWVSDKFIPALKNFSSWVKNNMPTITTAAAGLTAAIVAHKVAVLAAEAATKGLTLATIAQEAAHKALNLVMAATPTGLVITALAGVVAALAAYSLATKDATDKVEVLTAEERELMEAADEAAEAFREQQEALKEEEGNILAHRDRTKELADELMDLAGASGYVHEKDKERAKFILNELNEALGTEYEMTGNVIRNYGDLKKSIDQVIASKTANALLEANNEAYITAIQNEHQALEDVILSEKDYQSQLGYTNQKEIEYAEEYKRLQEELKQARQSGDEREELSVTKRIAFLDAGIQKERETLEEKKKAYEESAQNYENYHTTILNYEDAQAAALDGNAQKAIDLLTEKGQAYGQYSDKVDDETKKVLDTLMKEAIDAGIEAKNTKKNFEEGVDGYTKDMVQEAEDEYAAAMDKFATAYADAEGVGEDLSGGLQDGMENNRYNLLAKARSLVSGIIGAMRKEADSHSPSRKLIDFGEDLGEGAEIGIENSTKDVKRAATNQAAAILDSYSSREVSGQHTLRSIAERQANLRSASQIEAAAQNSGMLSKILAAIEKGQVLTIDGNKLVGATAAKTDTALGQRRVLVERGAK